MTTSVTALAGPASAAEAPAHGRMARIGFLAYGLFAYAAFFATFLYLIGFTAGLLVPKGVDDGPAGPAWLAVAVNAALVLLFAGQHTVMARPAFKAVVTRFIPAPIERSTFVLAACVCLGLLFWLWRPIPTPVWVVEHPWVRAFVWGVCASGWGLVLLSSFLISHFDLFGVRQTVLAFLARRYEHVPFRVVGPYRLVRHPLMLGFLLAFWAAPTMTWGHLLFSGLFTLYILGGIRIEERDLVRFFGEHYRQYRRHVPALFPSPVRRWREHR